MVDAEGNGSGRIECKRGTYRHGCGGLHPQVDILFPCEIPIDGMDQSLSIECHPGSYQSSKGYGLVDDAEWNAIAGGDQSTGCAVLVLSLEADWVESFDQSSGQTCTAIDIEPEHLMGVPEGHLSPETEHRQHGRIVIVKAVSGAYSC